jgi:hypothetical protein
MAAVLVFIGTACSNASGSAIVTTTIGKGINLTPHRPLPTGKPITVESTPNLACTLITPADASRFFAAASSAGQSLSDGSCWFTRATPVYKQLPTKMFLAIEPLNQYAGANQIFQEVRHARGAERVVVDGVPAYWTSLPLPLPVPPTVHVESGSLTTEKSGDVISAGFEFGDRAKAVSEQIMTLVLRRLGST